MAGGTKPTGVEGLAWCREVAARGAGEILLTSMDRDGTQAGYDLELLERGLPGRSPSRSSPRAAWARSSTSPRGSGSPTRRWPPRSSTTASTPCRRPRPTCARARHRGAAVSRAADQPRRARVPARAAAAGPRRRGDSCRPVPPPRPRPREVRRARAGAGGRAGGGRHRPHARLGQPGGARRDRWRPAAAPTGRAAASSLWRKGDTCGHVQERASRIARGLRRRHRALRRAADRPRLPHRGRGAASSTESARRSHGRRAVPRDSSGQTIESRKADDARGRELHPQAPRRARARSAGRSSRRPTR